MYIFPFYHDSTRLVIAFNSIWIVINPKPATHASPPNNPKILPHNDSQSGNPPQNQLFLHNKGLALLKFLSLVDYQIFYTKNKFLLAE